MSIPDTLKLRVDLFRQNAHAYQADGELFRVDSWTQVMFGQRLMPAQYHHLVRMMPEPELRRFLTSMAQGVQMAVEKLPSHSDFVRAYCAR